MAKFEYKSLVMNWGHGDATAAVDQKLNAMGADGWELVGMTRDESPDDDHEHEVVLFVFKRSH
jgi:hypothetical protein